MVLQTTEHSKSLKPYKGQHTFHSTEFAQKPIRKAASSYKRKIETQKRGLYKANVPQRSDVCFVDRENGCVGRGGGENMFRVFDQKVENDGDCPSCYSFTWKWTSFELCWFRSARWLAYIWSPLPIILRYHGLNDNIQRLYHLHISDLHSPTTNARL